jgi:hypothetical protein
MVRSIWNSAPIIALGCECLEQIPPLMRPATDLRDLPVGVEVIVDRMGVRDEVAAVPREQFVDARA